MVFKAKFRVVSSMGFFFKWFQLRVVFRGFLVSKEGSWWFSRGLLVCFKMENPLLSGKANPIFMIFGVFCR